MLTLLLAVNTLFGNCATNGDNFAYAPDSLTIGNHWVYKTALTSNDYATAHWWPVTDTPPVCETNMQAHAYGWAKHDYQVPREVIDWHCITNTSGEEEWIPVTNVVYDTKYWIERLYNKIPKPVPQPTYRAWTPLTIMRGAKANGTWAAIKTVLEANDALDEFMACQYCAECDQSFLGIRAIIVQQIGEEATAAFLDSLKVEKTGTSEELLGSMI